MTSDGSQEGTGTNPDDPTVGSDGTDQGGEPEVTLADKVAELSQKHLGFDLGAHIEEQRQEAARDAAATAAADAGRKAQQTYDTRIDGLEKALGAARSETDSLRTRVRESQIAALPKEEREAAKKLLETEEYGRGLLEMRDTVALAAKKVTAKEVALELREAGIKGVDEAELMKLDNPDAMQAYAAKRRLEDAERRLKEAVAGKDDNPDKDKSKQPPAASKKAPQQKAPKTTPTGGKPWEEQKGKGEKGLAEGLRAMQEADYTGE